MNVPDIVFYALLALLALYVAIVGTVLARRRNARLKAAREAFLRHKAERP